MNIKKNFNIKSFHLFFKAIANTKHEMWVSVQVLVAITILLSIVLWAVENSVQPEVYSNPLQTFLWASMQYIGDPGHFAEAAPVTIIGRIIAVLIGIIGIAIFAVPAGLIGSGFMDAIAEDKKEWELNEASIVLHKHFRRIIQTSSWYLGKNNLKYTYKFVPRYRSMSYLQVKTGMNVIDIVDAVRYCPDLRLANLSATVPSDKIVDSVVVIHSPINREYGCCIDRGSNVTIVSTMETMGPSNFAFSLAAMGCFNFVSKELSPSQDDPLSFYIMSKDSLDIIGDYDLKEDVESQALHFLDDLRKLKEHSKARGERHWFFFILGTVKTEVCQVHFWRLATDRKKELANRVTIGDRDYGCTICQDDEETFQHIYQDAQKALAERDVTTNDVKHKVITNIDNTDLLKGVLKSNVMRRVGGGHDCNSVTIRIGYEILVYSNIHLLMAKDLADAIRNYVEPNRTVDETILEEAERCYKKKGEGYADALGKNEIFTSDPNELRELIKKWSQEALEKYEHLDLDGNEQTDYTEHHQPSCWKKFWKRS